MNTKQITITVVTAILLIILISTANPIYFVTSGEKAVIKRFGVVNEQIIDEGLRFKAPFIDEVIKVNVRPQTIEGDAPTYTKDNQPIDVKFNVIYTNPVADIAGTVINYRGKPFENFANPKILDAIKAVGGHYTASEFVNKREIIRKELVKIAKDAVTNDGIPAINIIDIPITNIDFDDQYENAIKAKQVAQQDAQKAEYELQQAKVDAQSAIATAEGEARALTIKAQAISKSPSVIRLNEIEKWNGNYPLGAKVIGGGATIVDAE